MKTVKKSQKRSIVLLLALIFTLCLMTAAAPIAIAAADTLAAWTASSTMAGATSHAATTGAGTLSQSKNSIISWSSSAYGAQDNGAWAWDSGSGQFWQLSGIFTTGYNNLSVKLNVRSSGTGPRDFKVYYSTDGATYLPATANAVDYTAGNAAWNNNITIPLPDGAGNCASLSVRLVNSSNISARAGTASYADNEVIANGGTSQVQSISITGEPGGGGTTNISIAQANSTAAGQTVTVKGQATYLYANNSLMVQDGIGENDGICVFMSGANFSSYIGKIIEVSGVRTDYNGLKEIVPASLDAITVIDEPAFIAAPKEITVAELAAGKYIGSWVIVKDVQLTARNAATTAQNHTITQKGASVTLRAALSNAIAQGDWLTIAGCGYMFTTPQLFALEANILPGNEPPPAGESGSIAEWKSPTVTDVITATDGEYRSSSTLKIVGTSSLTLNWANSAINRAGGFDNRANIAYWLFSTSSTDFKNIEVSWSMRSSATGPRDFKLQYSTDGDTWHDADNPGITVGNALGINDARSQFSTTLPIGANDAPTLYARLLLATNTATNGSAIQSGGTNSVNNIVISGEYIVAANQLSPPQTDTPSGEIPLGQVITFAPDPKDAGVSGYTVMISGDDGATWAPALDGKYTLTTLPATFRVKATAPDMVDSRVISYSYTQAKLPMVTASKNSGAVIPGATVALDCAVSGSTIKYIMNGGAGQTYSEALTLLETLFIGDPATLTVEAWAEKDGYISGDITTFTYTKAVTGGEKVYFGQIHSHTTNSDGTGSLSEAYNYAKNVAGLSFFAVTDHSNSFDETGANSDNPANIDLNTYNVGSAKWQAGLQAAANAYVADEFISFYGYEMTWSGGPGHINTFNTGGFASRNNTALNAKTNDAGMRAYYELLTRTANSISMFNHPGTTFGNFNNFAYYDPVVDQRITLLEVGNGEGAVASGGYWRSYEQYTLALDKGWHVAPANNQDNHLGKWGSSNTCRTAIWTNDLSLNGVYQALRDKRVYATEVADLEIVYKVNGQPLGSIIDVVPASANFTAEISNSTAGNFIKSVSLITNGGAEIQKVTPNTPNYDYDRTITNPAAGYYYLKVIVSTPEGDRIAVTAPVWLGQGKAAGFVGVSSSAVMPVTGEALTITSTLFNNEPQGATLLSLEYKDQNGNSLGSFTGLDTPIAAQGETAHSITYTPVMAGNTTVSVSAVIKFADDSELTYTYDISYEVWDADGLVYIGIDGSHNNAYVNGNYKDSMGNFTAIAAEYGVRVVNIDTGEALIAAAANPKYQMLILNAPDRHTSVTEKKYYSQAEIDALTGFAQRGGMLIVAGLADYTEIAFANSEPDTSRHMAGQQNTLLAALGSTLRVADDEAHDYVYNRGGTNTYAIELTDAGGAYHWSSPLLEGVQPGQKYSQFSGCTIYSVDPAGKNQWNALPSMIIPATVMPVISTSVNGGSTDEDRDLAAVIIPQYDGKYMLMAAETLNHGNGATSQVIVAGGSFMSNFEVKVEMDNASTLQFSNYDICLNLIKSIAPAAVITDIADARKLPAGTKVTIEGIATTNVYSGNSAGNTGFFDCIYVQDNTGGINLFPVASGVAEGQKIRVTGQLSSYQGETQIAVTKLQVIDANINKLSPQNVTTQEAMDAGYSGLLVELSGIVSDIRKTGATIDQFTVTDASGTGALVYINAYITTAVDLSFVTEGAKVSVTGLASVGENLSSSDPLPRIRVRDRGEIKPAIIEEPSDYNFTVYMESAQTNLKAGDTLYVDIMLMGDINYTQVNTAITYDAAVLEFAGQTNLSGLAAEVRKTADNQVAVRSVSSLNMFAGAPCTVPVRVVTLKFTVKGNFDEESLDSKLAFSSIIVTPTAGVSATVAPGKPLLFTLR